VIVNLWAEELLDLTELPLSDLTCKCKCKVIVNLWAEELLDLTNLWANERPGKTLHGEGTDTQTDRQTHKQKDIATY
jgi:hypothetical protein